MELGDPIGTLESDLEVRYWIDQSDYTLVQGSVEGEMDLAGQVEMTITTSMTVRLSDYDVPVVVEPPEIATPKPFTWRVHFFRPSKLAMPRPILSKACQAWKTIGQGLL
jgi:hypothetical protein